MSTFFILGERQRSSDFFNMSKINRRIYLCARLRFNVLIHSKVYLSYTFQYRERFHHLIYIFDTKNLHTRRRDANYVRSIALWCALLRYLTVSSASGTTHRCDWERLASADKRMEYEQIRIKTKKNVYIRIKTKLIIFRKSYFPC